MGFGKSGNNGGFRTESRQYDSGYGLVLELENRLPRNYDTKLFGDPNGKGFLMRGIVADVLGAANGVGVPAVGDCVNVLLRKNDTRKAIFDDLEKSREDAWFLLEGVTGNAESLEARWSHGAGSNRRVQALEVVGPPRMSFQNPLPDDGPKSGWLTLNLDGSDTEFDVRESDGSFTRHVLGFKGVAARLKTALHQNLKFRISQRVLMPSMARLVDDQESLEKALLDFRQQGYTACVVRSFVGGAVNAGEVDVQLMPWPQDMPAVAQFPAKTYPTPVLQETTKFVALRDGDAEALMEVIPGYVTNLVGNKDVEKSTKHKFAYSIAHAGLTDSQKNMYGMQGYGPGITINAVLENGDVTGITRLAIRTQGRQYKSLLNIPTPHFLNADELRFNTDAQVGNAA